MAVYLALRDQGYSHFAEDRVFFYDERDKTLYATKMEEVVTYILKLEPWDQVDACVFNREMEWVLAVTHEDALLFLEFYVGQAEPWDPVFLKSVSLKQRLFQGYFNFLRPSS